MGWYLLVVSPFLLAIFAGLAGMFRKAGLKGWKAFVPGLNLWMLLQLTDRPKWWMLLHLFPLTSGFVWLILMSDLARLFGRFRFYDRLLVFFLPFLYLPWLGLSDSAVYNKNGMPPKETRLFIRELADGLVYAVAAALFLRLFFFTTIRIPTPSMEGSLKVGDFILVSKVHYGPRLPMAPLALPFFSNHFPGSKVKTYLPGVRLPYGRLPGLGSIERNDIVVFNYPMDDLESDAFSPDSVRIPSQKQTYIKRCVALPGDFVQIVDGVLFINGAEAWIPPLMKEVYRIETRKPLNPDFLELKGFRLYGPNRDVTERTDRDYEFFMTRDKAKEVEQWDQVLLIEGPEGVENAMKQNNYVFPRNPAKYRWDLYNFGMLRVPQRGDTIRLDQGNRVIYERIIEGYEGHDFYTQEKQFFIDGQPRDWYVFEMDYYFMMGDNRYNSMDSRYWGFVPEDHIEGKPLFILFSKEEGNFRKERMLSRVSRYEP